MASPLEYAETVTLTDRCVPEAPSFVMTSKVGVSWPHESVSQNVGEVVPCSTDGFGKRLAVLIAEVVDIDVLVGRVVVVDVLVGRVVVKLAGGIKKNSSVCSHPFLSST